MAEVKAYVDNVKRARLLFLAAAISITIFVTKLIQVEDITSGVQAMGRAGIYFAITYFGLLWALRFQVGVKSLLYVLPQSALFVFSEVLFLDLFLFRAFDRVYEAIILFFLLIIIFIGTYVSFLTANVFNVSQFKKIPLIQVGKTSSYILSLFTTYFLTYSLLAAGLAIYFVLPLAALAYLITVYSHIHHLGISKKLRWTGVVGTVWVMIILLTATMFVSSAHEVVALLPTVTMYSMVGVILNRDQDALKPVNIIEYVSIILIAVGLIFYLN